MTKTKNLRPTLPDDMNAEFKELISDCWHGEPSLRPSFSVVLIRLQHISHVTVRHHGSQHFSDSTSSGARTLCRGINDLLWNYAPAKWDQATADMLISKDATLSAHDPTLNKVLCREKGPSSAKSLGKMMFGGMEE